MRSGSLLILLFLPLWLFGQWSAAEQQIDELFKDQSAQTPGYVVGVFHKGEYLFKKGYGSANLEYQIPIDEHSAFNIASLSKQFTAAALALLILDNKVDLEDPVGDYLEDFPFKDSKMQVKHLVYMTSGINDYYYNERTCGDWSTLQFFNIDTAIQASYGSGELMYEPGSQWSYSNINYMLLTKIVEKVSGQSFASFLQERLFKPLQMEHTLVNDDVFTVIPGRVNGYNERTEENTDWMLEYGYLNELGEGYLQLPRNSPHYGGSGMYTTLDDLGKWLANFATKEFGGKAFYDQMHQTMEFEHDKTNDAFGLFFGDFNGRSMVAYEGGDWGFSSFMMRFPDNELSIVVLSNIGTGRAASKAYQIMDILVDLGLAK